MYDRLYGAGQSIKHNAHADHHEHCGECAAYSCLRRQIAKADGSERLYGNVKTIKYRPAFQQVKYDGTKGNRSQNRDQNDADAGTTGEKETRQGC